MYKRQQETTVTVEIKQTINGLQGAINELKEDVVELSPEAISEFDGLEKSLKKLDEAGDKDAVAKSGALNKIKRFLQKADDTGTSVGKAVQKVKDGVSMAQDIAEHYNSIAQWCGLAQVPKPFLKN